jgi:hypothetical protein
MPLKKSFTALRFGALGLPNSPIAETEKLTRWRGSAELAEVRVRREEARFVSATSAPRREIELIGWGTWCCAVLALTRAFRVERHVLVTIGQR